MLMDLRAAVRALLRTPRMAAAAALCIALGGAAVTAALSLLWATALRPLPFPEPDRLVRVWLESPAEPERGELSYADIADLRELRSLDRLEATARARLILAGPDGGRRTEGEAVTEGYFELVGARAARGRLFTAEEYGSGAAVILLSHAAWGTLFGHSPDAVGATVQTGDGPRTVVGILEASFTGTIEEDSGDLEFWVPIRQWVTEPQLARRDIGGTWAIGRLAAGRTLSHASQDSDALSERIARVHPAERAAARFAVEPLSENWRAGLRTGTWLLLGASMLLLLVAAANVAGLLLARAVARRRELAVRTALGASRGRITRLLLIEALLIAAVGGTVGVAIGPLVFMLFHRMAPVAIPAYVPLEADPITALLAAAVLGLTAVAAGVAPALLAAGGNTMATLREGGRGATPGVRERYWGGALVVTEVAVTVVLLASAGLLLRSYRALETADLGIRTERLLRVGLFTDDAALADPAAMRSLHARARERLLRDDAIESVGLVWPTLPMWATVQVPVQFAGMPAEAQERGLSVGWFRADADFFEVTGLRLVAGRTFDAADGPDAAPVAIVSESLAARMGGERVLGATLAFDGIDFRVVGVVRDALFTMARAPASEREVFFTSMAQWTPLGLVSFVMRTRAEDPAAALPAVRAALAEVAPRTVLDWTGPVDQAFGDRYVTDRFLVALTGAFALTALALAAVGLFAVLAHLVARTRTEFGVRLALGATRARVVRGVVAGALRTVTIGLAIGLVAALAASHALGSVLYGIGRFDPWSYGSSAVVLLLVAAAAAALPALRAASVHPAESLQSD